MSGAVVPIDPPIRVAGHFGEFLQGRLGPDGPVGLVTVPCAALGAEAVAEPGRFSVAGSSEKAAQQLFDATGGVPDMRFRVTCDAPLGAGAGMSTAALMAVAQAAGRSVTAQDLQAVEGAVDPLMLDDPGAVLWASREARVLQSFCTLPEFTIVGGFYGDEIRTDAGDENFPDITDIVAFWADAVARQDRAALAGIATEAARRTTALRGPNADPTEDLARELGALGMVRAHTGSARGLLFAPGKVSGHVGAALVEAGLKDVLHFQTGGAR